MRRIFSLKLSSFRIMCRLSSHKHCRTNQVCMISFHHGVFHTSSEALSSLWQWEKFVQRRLWNNLDNYTLKWNLYHKLRFVKFVECSKWLFHHSRICIFLICIRLWSTTTSDRLHPLNIRKREPYKNFNIFYIKSYPWNTLQLLQFI